MNPSYEKAMHLMARDEHAVSLVLYPLSQALELHRDELR